MVRDDYRYTIDFFHEDGSAAGQVPITPDWAPALEWAHFDAVRRALLPAVTTTGAGTIEPLWQPKTGEPYLSGFRVAISASGSLSLSHEFPSAYFRSVAQQASARLVEQGTLKEGEAFRYLVCALPQPVALVTQPAEAAFSVEEVVQPLPIEDTSLTRFLDGAQPIGTFETGVDIPVFIPQEILDETTALAQAAGDVETGGVLVGKLHRDADVPEIFVEITAQITARHTEAASTKLTFTADTWAAVRAALALRKQRELMLSWWHYHPDFCRLRGCPLERRRVCTASSAFFSAEDVQLHRTIFGRAYHTALLISDNEAEGLTPSFYGWRRGVVATRGFYVVDSERRLSPQKFGDTEKKASELGR